MRAFDNLYEEPAFEAPSPKEQSVVYAALGLGTVAVAVASTVAAIQLQLPVGPPSWLSAAYVRTSLWFLAPCAPFPFPFPISFVFPFTFLGTSSGLR